MPPHLNDVIGRVLPAPENHLSADKLELARKARRSFMGKALAMGAGVAASATAATRAVAAEGEEAILKLPTHTTGLGHAAWPWSRATASPSKWETNLQPPPKPRPDPCGRRLPSVSRPCKAYSASSRPAACTSSVTTKAGGTSILPSTVLMINGLVKRERVFTMDDLMRLPSVSRIHFIECGANSAHRVGQRGGAHRSVHPRHGQLLANSPACCCPPCWRCAAYDKKNGKYVLGRRCRWFFHDPHHLH